MNTSIVNQVFVKFLAVLISLVWTVSFARYVDVEVRGEVVYVMGVLVTLIAVLTFGAPALITKGISSSRLLVADSHRISIVLSAIVCFPCSIIFLFLVGIEGIAINIFFVVAIFSQIFFTFQQAILFSLQKQIAIYTIELASKAIAFSVYLLTDRGETSYYVCFLMSFVISSSCVLYSYRLGVGWANVTTFLKDNFRAGALLFSVNLAIYLFIKADILILGGHYSSYEVGIYSVALSFCEFLFLFNAIVGNIFFPRVSSLADIFEKKSLLKEYLSKLTLLYLLGASTMFFVSDLLINFTFGDKYRESADILNILFLSYVFLSLIAICNNFMASIGIPKTVIFITFVALSAKTCLIFLFKETESLLAVAYINLACTLLLAVFYIMYALRKT